jgi:hypothetical protein
MDAAAIPIAREKTAMQESLACLRRILSEKRTFGKSDITPPRDSTVDSEKTENGCLARAAITRSAENVQLTAGHFNHEASRSIVLVGGG